MVMGKTDVRFQRIVRDKKAANCKPARMSIQMAIRVEKGISARTGCRRIKMEPNMLYR